MRARASGVRSCPSGVRRKMASGAGQLPRSWTTFDHSLWSAAVSASVTFERSMALRAPRRDALELLADEGADAEAEGVEVVRLLDAVVEDDELRALVLVELELAQRVAVERREQQVAHADVELDDLDLGLARRLGRRLVVLDEERADEAAAEVGEREALRLEAVLGVARARRRSRRATGPGCAGRP